MEQGHFPLFISLLQKRGWRKLATLLPEHSVRAQPSGASSVEFESRLLVIGPANAPSSQRPQGRRPEPPEQSTSCERVSFAFDSENPARYIRTSKTPRWRS